MELFLIRHAQSLNNARPEHERLADPPLTDLGRRQAALLGESISQLGLTRLITSPFRRTLETTAHIQMAAQLTPEVRVQLHEQGGCYSGYAEIGRVGQPGLSRPEIESEFAGFQIDPDLDGQGWWRSQDFEPTSLARVRARGLLDWTRVEFGDSSERVAFVMHADIKVLLLNCFDFYPVEFPCNASITHIRIAPAETRVESYNRVDHLPADAVSA